MIRQFSAQPSIKDDRDFIATMLVPKLEIFPKDFRIAYEGEIKDQGQVGSCVAHSAAYCREMVEQKQTGVYKKFSIGFIYGNREETDYQGEGMMPREMLKSLQTHGAVLYNEFPYNEDYPVVKQFLSSLKEKLYTSSAPHKISAYARLNDSDELKSALMQLGPVTICIPVHDAYQRLTKTNNIVPIPKFNDKCLGYHENTIVGWTTVNDQEYWIDLNSWGPEWGNKGYCLLPFEFPMVEAWSITDNIVPQPSPDPRTHLFLRVQSKKYILKFYAVNLAKQAVDAGFTSAIVTAFDGKYVVQVGAFTEGDREKAVNELKKIKKRLPYAKFEIKLS